MTNLRRLIRAARTDIADADRCITLGISPAARQLHRRLREVTNELESLRDRGDQSGPRDLDAIIRGIRASKKLIATQGSSERAQVHRLLDQILTDLESLRDKGDQSRPADAEAMVESQMAHLAAAWTKRPSATASDRDGLILAVRDIVNDGKRPELHLAGYEAARIADAAIAAGWRPAPPLVTTIEEANALPETTVARTPGGGWVEKSSTRDSWFIFASECSIELDPEAHLPLAIIATPTTEGASS